jgi:hypothetical protein
MNGCFLTGDNEGIVKLWSKEKRLLSELNFLEAPSTAVFAQDDFGLLIGHKNLISEMESP